MVGGGSALHNGREVLCSGNATVLLAGKHPRLSRHMWRSERLIRGRQIEQLKPQRALHVLELHAPHLAACGNRLKMTIWRTTKNRMCLYLKQLAEFVS